MCTLQLRNTQFESANKNLSAMDKSSYTLGLDLPGDVSDPGDEFEVCRVLLLVRVRVRVDTNMSLSCQNGVGIAACIDV